MSNALKLVPWEIEIPSGVLKSCPVEVKDTDGNWVLPNPDDKGGALFRLAEFTTWRDLAYFVRTNIAPFIKDEHKDEVYVDVPEVREEGDGFRREFMLKIRYSQDYQKVFAN